LVLKESDLSVETLLKSIKILLDDPETAEITRENAHNMFETKASLLIRANLLALEIGMSVKDFK
jgi:UDP-N-acetylglucosamine:LPS N-acetylglucosamine transferase